MDPSSTPGRIDAVWESQIRECEETARAAFLAADTETLDRLWADGFAVNSPLERVLDKKTVLELLMSGRIRHSTYEIEIEHMNRHGDVVVVMGKDRVTNPSDGSVSQRRYTNIWLLESGSWCSIARHAHVSAREAAKS
jgi:hypothetical protein